MKTLDDLLNAIFDSSRPIFYAEFEAWARSSRRFRDFATRYHSKIRAKLRNAPGEGGLLDLRAELEVAVLLLQDRQFALEYEKYAALKQRGPDFTVTFKTHTPFNVEVRRIRCAELGDDDAEARALKLVAVLCDKVGQMPPGIVNLLWLAADCPLSEASVNDAMALLRQLAERKVEDFFMRRGFKSATDFLRHYQHLSGIVVWQPGAHIVVPNALTRHKPPPEIVRALQQLETG